MQSPERGFRIENKADDVAKVYVYDEIGFFGVTAKDFVAELNTVTASQVDVHLNSPGGDVFDGIAIYNALKEYKGKVTTVVDGLAASAASFVFQAGEERIVTKNATLMIHDAFGLCVGNSADMREMAELLDKTSDNLASIYAERGGKDAATWRAAMREETWYSADEAVAAGLADSVRGRQQEAPTNVWDVRFFNLRTQKPAAEPVQASTNQDAVRIDLDQITNALKEAWA